MVPGGRIKCGFKAGHPVCKSAGDRPGNRLRGPTMNRTKTRIAGLLLGAAALSGCASYGYSDGYYGDGD